MVHRIRLCGAGKRIILTDFNLMDNEGNVRMSDHEMIERCAQALSTAIENFRDTHKPGEVFEAPDMVLAVIKAMREPTEAMRNAKDKYGDGICWGYDCHICGGITDDKWKLVIDSITGVE